MSAAVRYELLIQAKDPATPFDPAQLETVLASLGGKENPDGTRTWALKHGEVEVQRLVEGGKPIGTALRVVLSDRLDLIREAVVEGSRVAEEAGLALFDPQLTRFVTAKEEGLVADKYFQTAAYAGQYAGVQSAIIAGFGSEDPGMKAGTKVLLALGTFFLVLYVVLDWLL
jgi:hypothetical protein